MEHLRNRWGVASSVWPSYILDANARQACRALIQELSTRGLACMRTQGVVRAMSHDGFGFLVGFWGRSEPTARTCTGCGSRRCSAGASTGCGRAAVAAAAAAEAHSGPGCGWFGERRCPGRWQRCVQLHPSLHRPQHRLPAGTLTTLARMKRHCSLSVGFLSSSCCYFALIVSLMWSCLYKLGVSSVHLCRAVMKPTGISGRQRSQLPGKVAICIVGTSSGMHVISIHALRRWLLLCRRLTTWQGRALIPQTRPCANAFRPHCARRSAAPSTPPCWMSPARARPRLMRLLRTPHLLMLWPRTPPLLVRLLTC